MSTPAFVDYYETYWRDGYWVENPYERWKLELVRGHITGAMPQRTRGHDEAESALRVLDVGCGDGRVLAALAPLGIRGFGLDVSRQALALAARRGVESARADLDGGALPVEDRVFDVALCLDVLEHVFAPDHVLAQIHRALSPGGRLLVAVPNGLNLWNRAAFVAGRHVDIMDKAHLSGWPFSEHLRFFSRAVLEATLDRAGFAPVERHYFFPDRFTDARFRMAGALARAVTAPRLHERLPSLFALEFLYACERKK